MKQQIDQLSSNVEELQRQVIEQAKINLRMQSENEKNSYVSFTATASEQRVYGAGDHVLFDYIVRNYGDSYFAGNSTFICPQNGYYLFSIFIRSGKWRFLGNTGTIILFTNQVIIYKWVKIISVWNL